MHQTSFLLGTKGKINASATKLPISKLKKGGEYLHILMMGPSLSQQGGMATVENLIMDRTAEDIKIRHVTTHEEGTVLHRIWIFCIALAMLFLNLLRNRCDLVHLHVSERGSVVRVSILILIARFFRKPVIIHAHGCEFHTFYSSLTVFFQRCVSLAFRQCVCVFVLSKSWRDYYVSQCGLLPERTVVVTNPVDFPTTVPDRSGLDKINLLFLGRVGQRKGAFDLLQAFSRLSKEDKERSTLILAGDGEINDAYTMAESLEIQPFVSIPGWLSQEKCKELLAQADIFVLPSYNEALPMSILEAMSWGLPIISTPVGGIPEIVIPCKTGILVTPGDVQGIKEAIQFFIENEEQRISMGLVARNCVAPLAIENYASHLADVYRRAITSRTLQTTDFFSMPAINLDES